MNVEDADIAWAERDASPTRMRDYDREDGLQGEYDRIHEERRQSHPVRKPAEEVEEAPLEQVETRRARRTDHDGASSISSVSTVERPVRNRNMSTVSKTSTRFEGDMMAYLDRHPTAIERIEAHKLQHSLTVGSRKAFTGEGVELPDFGGTTTQYILYANDVY